MDCLKASYLLDSYLDKALNPTEARALESHLSSCYACREALGEMARTFALLDELRPAIAPPFFLARVMAKVKEKKLPHAGLSRLAARLWAPALGLLGLSSLALSLDQEAGSSPGLMLFPQGFGLSITDPLDQFSGLTSSFVTVGAVAELWSIMGVVLVFLSLCGLLLEIVGPSGATGGFDR